MGPVKVMQNLVNSLVEINNLQFKVFYIDEDIDPLVTFSAPVKRLDYSEFPFEEFDIVHTNGIRPDYFAWRNRKKIKYHISTIHNFVFEDLRYTYNKIISLIFGHIWLILWRRADKLVCVSEAMENYYKAWFDSVNLDLVHNGICENVSNIEEDNEIVRAIIKFRNRGLKIIGSAGIITKIKGIGQLLTLLEIEKGYAFVLLGDGKELTKLKSLAKKLNISDRCCFCGFKSDAVNYIKHFDCYISPSRSEGFGLALVEAVQQKVPVVCSDIEVFRELFYDSEVTFFKLNDLGSLQEACKEAIIKSSEKTDSAYSRYINSYTDKIMSEKYFRLYLSA